MKRLVCFSVVLFSAASFALGADNTNSHKNSSKSGGSPTDHNVFHALQKLFKGKGAAAPPGPTPIRHRKAMKRAPEAEEANPVSSPESKTTPEPTPSPTPRRVVLPESSAKPTASPTPVPSPSSDASPTPIVVPLPSPGKGDETPKGSQPAYFTGLKRYWG